MDMAFSAERTLFVHKDDAPLSGPRIADTNFTDTRIFLKKAGITNSGPALRGQRAWNKPQVKYINYTSMINKWLVWYPSSYCPPPAQTSLILL